MYFFEEKKSNNFQSIVCSTNLLLFDVPTIWIHYFVLFFSILSPKKKGETKRKSQQQQKKTQAAWFFFILCWKDIYLRLIIYHYLSNWCYNEFKQHVTCCSVIQSSIEPNFFSVERKLQKWIHLSIRHCYFFKDLPHYLFDKKLFCLIRIRLKVTPVFISFDEIRKNYILKLLYYRVHLA